MSKLSQDAYSYPYETTVWIRLECTDNGHNKFYEMVHAAHAAHADSWVARWGGIGSPGQSMTYPKCEWMNKLIEKLAKGYVICQSETGQSVPMPVTVIPTQPPNVELNAEYLTRIKQLLTDLEQERRRATSATVTEWVKRIEQSKDILSEYEVSGKLTQLQMQTLNKIHEFFLQSKHK